MAKKYAKPRYTGQKSLNKIKGFGYYIHSNEKLTKKERADFLNRGNKALIEIYNSLNMSVEIKINAGISGELDSSLTDIELKDIWNSTYEKYGFLSSEFKEKWEKEVLRGDNKFFKQSEKFENENKLQELIERVEALEMEVKLLKRRKGIVEDM